MCRRNGTGYCIARLGKFHRGYNEPDQRRKACSQDWANQLPARTWVARGRRTTGSAGTHLIVAAVCLSHGGLLAAIAHIAVPLASVSGARNRPRHQRNGHGGSFNMRPALHSIMAAVKHRHCHQSSFSGGLGNSCRTTPDRACQPSAPNLFIDHGATFAVSRLDGGRARCRESVMALFAMPTPPRTCVLNGACRVWLSGWRPPVGSRRRHDRVFPRFEPCCSPVARSIDAAMADPHLQLRHEEEWRRRHAGLPRFIIAPVSRRSDLLVSFTRKPAEQAAR